MNKKVLVYMTPDKQFYTVRSHTDIEKMINQKPEIDETTAKQSRTAVDQLSLF
jgi:hypothetical protein